MRVAQLDVSTKAGLWKMRAYILLSFVTVLWSRVFRYAYLILALMSDFIEAEDWGFVCGGAVAALLMSAFNVLVFVDTSAKLYKFCKMRIDPKATTLV